MKSYSILMALFAIIALASFHLSNPRSLHLGGGSFLILAMLLLASAYPFNPSLKTKGVPVLLFGSYLTGLFYAIRLPDVLSAETFQAFGLIVLPSILVLDSIIAHDEAIKKEAERRARLIALASAIPLLLVFLLRSSAGVAAAMVFMLLSTYLLTSLYRHMFSPWIALRAISIPIMAIAFIAVTAQFDLVKSTLFGLNSGMHQTTLMGAVTFLLTIYFFRGEK